MDNSIIYKKAENYVVGLFDKTNAPNLLFHNLQHTKKVVERTKEIAAHYNLSENDMLILFVAAWFHDTGHLFVEPKKHEDKSAEIMRNFMVDYTKDEDLIKEIEKCILATKNPRNPSNLLQEIICDADTFHLGTKEFKKTNKKVYKEYILREGKMDKTLYNHKTLDLLKAHQFFTNYAQKQLNEKKQENIIRLEKKVTEKEEQFTEDLKIDDANSLTTKGIQTMLRLTSENHLKLSDMADNKANILISVNAIIISVILGVLMRKLQEETYLTIPTIIFLASAVTTIVISILATRPKISEGTFTEQDLLDKKVNLLFFGNFHKTNFEHYDIAMRQMMKDPDYLYGTLIKDIYLLGVVLGRKYKLIRLAYYIFMIGIIVSVIAFTIAVIMEDSKNGNSSSVFPFK